MSISSYSCAGTCAGSTSTVVGTRTSAGREWRVQFHEIGIIEVERVVGILTWCVHFVNVRPCLKIIQNASVNYFKNRN